MLHCNVGKVIVNQKCDLKGYSTVWYHPKGIVNILSLHKVQKIHKVIDSSRITGFVVHKADGANCMFKTSKRGLIFSDVKWDISHVLVNTVDSMRNKDTVEKCSDTHKAQSFQEIIGRPITKDYIRYVENNMLPAQLQRLISCGRKTSWGLT